MVLQDGTLDVSKLTAESLKYSYIRQLGEGLHLVMDWPFKGVINHGGEVIVPFVYNSLQVFQDGLCLAERDGLFGMVNEEGLEVIPCQFEAGFRLVKKVGWAKKDGKWFLINNKAERLLDVSFEEAETNGHVSTVMSGGKWGLLRNSTGVLNVALMHKKNVWAKTSHYESSLPGTT